MASPVPEPRRARRWPLVLGGLAALALVATALLDFGDPLERVRREVELAATARADAVRTAWAGLRSDRGPFEGALGEFAVEVPDRRPGFAVAPEPDTAERDRLGQALARAARGARARGDGARAEELGAEAAERTRGADPRTFAEVALDRARWAAADGRAGDVALRRAELVEFGDPGASVGGTSVPLLAALVPPVDADLALRALEVDGALPVPHDRLAPTSGPVAAGPGLVEDPWWAALRARLAAAAPEVDWDGAFRLDARRGEAVRAVFGGVLGGTEERWSLTRRAGGLFAVRRVADGVAVAATSEARIAERLAARLSAGSGAGTTDPYRVRFDHEPEPLAERVREREWLDGTSLGFTVHAEDPYRAGRIEAARLGAVRAGLVVLAVAILCAALLSDRATRRARRLERARSLFVASVSHDLRTPIQSILLMSETLERGRVAGETSRARYFSTIRQEAERLRRFVEDVLDGARLDRGEGARVERQTVDSVAFFDGLERGLRERAERDRARVEFVRGALPETLELDPDGTLRIVWNLFENALRHGRADGEPADVRVEVEALGGVLSIAVHDRGPGVPARYASSIFEPFERAEAEAAGTGLGLAIVRALARAHGGDAELAAADHGARFVARLDVQRPSLEDPAA